MNKYTNSLLKIIQEVKPGKEFSASSISKISLKDNNSFSLPAGPNFSCPGATQACKDCYAMKKRHHFPNVQTNFAKNWLLLKKFEKSKDIKSASELILNIIPPKAKVFRIHESGDFHSQWYIKVWADVVKARPEINFWAYTRSFHLNFSPLTKYPNFTLWASTDPHNIDKARKFVRRFKKSGTKHAYGPWDHNINIPKNSFICPVTNGKMDISGACEKCQLCIVKKRVNKNVVFMAH